MRRAPLAAAKRNGERAVGPLRPGGAPANAAQLHDPQGCGIKGRVSRRPSHSRKAIGPARGQPPGPPSSGTGPGHSRHRFWLFAARFVAALLFFSVLATLFSIQNRLGWVERALAQCVAVGARVFHPGLRREGNVLVAGGYGIEINHECTAIFVLMIYAAFVWAYPARPWERVRGLLLGAAVLTAVNIARLIALVVIIERWPPAFDYLHEYFFQVLFLGLVTALANRWLGSLSVRREFLGLPS